jgi:hypothetical protein
MHYGLLGDDSPREIQPDLPDSQERYQALSLPEAPLQQSHITLLNNSAALLHERQGTILVPEAIPKEWGYLFGLPPRGRKELERKRQGYQDYPQEESPRPEEGFPALAVPRCVGPEEFPPQPQRHLPQKSLALHYRQAIQRIRKPLTRRLGEGRRIVFEFSSPGLHDFSGTERGEL